MGNGIESSSDLDGTTPLEQALDRATEQYMAAQHERRGRRRAPARTSTTTAIVVDGQHNVLPARLSWKGIEVTEEFQEYAARVARGEQLAPYRGQVLARACPEFPWGAPRHEDTSTEALPQFRSRVPRVAAWVFGVGSLLMAGLGIGSGTASTAEIDPFVLPPTTTALALRPRLSEDALPGDPLDDSDAPIASAIESALQAARAPASAGSRGLASPTPRVVAKAPAPPDIDIAAALAELVPHAAAERVPAPLAARTAPAPGVTIPSAATPAAQPWSLKAGPNGASTGAAMTSATSGAATELHESSALFSDQPPF